MADRAVWWQAQDEASMQTMLDVTADEPFNFVPAPAPQGADLEVLHRVAWRLADERVKVHQSGDDQELMEQVKALDELVRSANLLVERLREWHALHDLEAVRSAADAEELVRLVLDKAAGGSEGEQVPAIHGLAQALSGVQSAWSIIEARVQQSMAKIAPNVTALVGPMVGARIITIAGGLPRLAGMPAGTIQTLGAETALFRSFKEGSKPPKHGVIFQHPLVFQAPRWQRGSVARTLANHLALAARADGTTGNNIIEHLQDSLESDLTSLRQRKSNPPVMAQQHGGRGGGKRTGPRRTKRGNRRKAPNHGGGKA